MRKLAIAFLAVVLLSGIGAVFLVNKTNPVSGPSVSILSQPDCAVAVAPRDLVGCIRNDDVQWQGTFDGLHPKLSGATANLVRTEEIIEPMLLEAVLDKNRFAAAHVLLTYRAQGTFVEVEGEWNGLRVRLVADQPISYEGNDLAKLHARWEKELQQ